MRNEEKYFNIHLKYIYHELYLGMQVMSRRQIVKMSQMNQRMKRNQEVKLKRKKRKLKKTEKKLLKKNQRR